MRGGHSQLHMVQEMYYYRYAAESQAMGAYQIEAIPALSHERKVGVSVDTLLRHVYGIPMP